MSSEPAVPGKRWKLTGAVIGALVGVIITAVDNLYNALGLGPEMRTAYQLLGLIGGGYLGATVGKVIDRRQFHRRVAARESPDAEPGPAPGRGHR